MFTIVYALCSTLIRQNIGIGPCYHDNMQVAINNIEVEIKRIITPRIQTNNTCGPSLLGTYMVTTIYYLDYLQNTRVSKTCACMKRLTKLINRPAV